jgi:hypothetical protein
MIRIMKPVVSAKNHVVNHKFEYAMAAVAIAAIALQQKNLRDMYAFLEEKGIDKMEFLNPEWYEELSNAKAL